MRLTHILLAILIAALWGFNFVVLHLGLQQLSPQMLCLIRFMGASLPAIFFIKKPAAPFPLILLYGLIMFALQFSFLFAGLRAGMTPGLSSLLMQTQAFFTIILACSFFKEKPSKWQLCGALISFSGIALVGLHLDSHITISGFFLVLAAAFSWSIGNIISKKIGPVNMFSLVIWGSFIAWPPLLLYSLLTEGSAQLIYSFSQLNWLSILSILYIIYLSTIVSFVIWNWLLAKYPTAVVAPFTLLVPIFAMLGSVLFLDEALTAWKIQAALLVISGIAINIFAPRLIFSIQQAFAPARG